MKYKIDDNEIYKGYYKEDLIPVKWAYAMLGVVAILLLVAWYVTSHYQVILNSIE